MHNISRVLLLGFMLFPAPGCVRDLERRVDDQISRDMETIKAAKQQADTSDQKQSIIRKTGRPPLDLKKRYFEHPAWADTPVYLAASVELPLEHFLYDLVDKIGKRAVYENGVDPKVPVALLHNGPLKELFAVIAGKLDLHYQITDEAVIFSALVSRTFEIDMFPGERAYQLGSADDDAASMVDAGGGAAAETFTAAAFGNTGEYSNISGNFSIWEDLTHQITPLLSEDGVASVSQSTASVTVRDRPSNVRAIGEVIEQINEIITRQVVLDVQLVEVTLNDAGKLGVDWNSVRETINTSIRFANQPGANFFDTDGDGSLFNFSRIGTSSLSGASFLIQALREQGQVTVENTPRVVALNNRPAEIRIAGTTFFVQNSSINNVADAGTTTGAQQSSIVTGFSLFVLPRIKKDRVILHLSNNVTDLISLDVKTIGATQVESPTLVNKGTNGSTSLRHGETLLLSGVRTYRNSRDDSKTFGILATGRDVSTRYTESILLITARIKS